MTVVSAQQFTKFHVNNDVIDSRSEGISIKIVAEMAQTIPNKIDTHTHTMYVCICTCILPCTYMHARYSGDGDAADTFRRPTDTSALRHNNRNKATTTLADSPPAVASTLIGYASPRSDSFEPSATNVAGYWKCAPSLYVCSVHVGVGARGICTQHMWGVVLLR